MARKVIFNINNTLVATINKINQMDEWLGDLDDLNKRNYNAPLRSYLGGFEDNEYVENGGPADQSAVAAAEWLHQELAKARFAMFGYELVDSDDSIDSNLEIATIRFNKVIVADSAVFGRLTTFGFRVPVDSDLSPTSATVIRDSLDSNFIYPSFEGGPRFNTGLTIDSGYIRNFSGNHLDVGKWFTTDSGFRTFFDDSSDSLGNFVPLFDFGLTIRDSAYIGTLHGPRSVFKFPRPRKPGFPNGYTFDSSTIDINTPLSFDSGKSTISFLAPDSSDSSTNHVLRYDSGTFNRIIVGELDSSSDDSAISRALSNLDSGILNFDTLKLPNLDSLYDSIADLRPGIGGDSAGRVTYHGDLTDGFQFTTLFAIYESDATNIVLGGYLLSQYDSDDHAL